MSQVPFALHEIPPRAALAFQPPHTEATLNHWRTQGDPLADAVVARLAEAGPITDYHDLLGRVRERAAEEGGVFRDFLTVCETVPDWADFQAMTRGQEMLAAFPLHISAALFAGSLVGGAVFVKMALVTAMTGMLSGDSSRRLDETGAMVLRMAFPGCLEPGGAGHELLMRVRLLHAAIRRMLVDTGRFQHPREVPVNQQDLAITLGLFDYVNLRSLAMMHLRFEEAELASFHLMWRYAGHVLGIDPRLLPQTVYDQQAFFLASLKHQGRPERLDQRNLKVMDDVARNLGGRWPGLSEARLREALYQICRWLTGDDYVQGMGIRRHDGHWALRGLRGSGWVLNQIWHRLPGGRRLLVWSGRRWYRALLVQTERRRDRQGTYRVRTVEPS